MRILLESFDQDHARLFRAIFQLVALLAKIAQSFGALAIKILRKMSKNSSYPYRAISDAQLRAEYCTAFTFGS